MQEARRAHRAARSGENNCVFCSPTRPLAKFLYFPLPGSCGGGSSGPPRPARVGRSREGASEGARGGWLARLGCENKRPCFRPGNEKATGRKLDEEAPSPGDHIEIEQHQLSGPVVPAMARSAGHHPATRSARAPPEGASPSCKSRAHGGHRSASHPGRLTPRPRRLPVLSWLSPGAPAPGSSPQNSGCE